MAEILALIGIVLGACGIALGLGALAMRDRQAQILALGLCAAGAGLVVIGGMVRG